MHQSVDPSCSEARLKCACAKVRAAVTVTVECQPFGDCLANRIAVLRMSLSYVGS